MLLTVLAGTKSAAEAVQGTREDIRPLRSVQHALRRLILKVESEIRPLRLHRRRGAVSSAWPVSATSTWLAAVIPVRPSAGPLDLANGQKFAWNHTNGCVPGEIWSGAARKPSKLARRGRQPACATQLIILSRRGPFR